MLTFNVIKALNRPTGMKALLYLLKQCLMKTDFCCCHCNVVVFFTILFTDCETPEFILSPSAITDSFDFLSYPTTNKSESDRL